MSIVGGGGPMGRMHLQRMLEMAEAPQDRRRGIQPRPQPGIWSHPLRRWPQPGIELVVLNPEQMPPEVYAAALATATTDVGSTTSW